ncbi:MAG: dehypoxanthine futalosine cyclase [Chloroflexi bacterium]|nr:dehypoxanthine futalosine cyclase [Chloroflexota bacterium]
MSVDKILHRAERGERISFEEALTLYTQAPLDALGEVAHRIRLRKTDPQVVTYLVDRNINYTNVCITNCQFCAFYRPPGHPEAYVLSYEDIGRRVEELVAWGGTRILMQGGHHPTLPLTWYEALLRYLSERYPTIEIDAFSPSEIDHIARLEGLTTREVLERLMAAGLRGLPGGGAEILDDEIRRRISPKKQRTAGWLGVMREAQALGLATSATMVIGFGEGVHHRVRHLQRLRELQDESLRTHGNGFTAFIPWTAQISQANSLGRSRFRDRYGAGYDEYLRLVAISRIFLDNFDHIQASWPTQGEEIARKALHFGADDFGSTMLEENVVSAASAFTARKPRMSVEDIHRHIRMAGFIPRQRDTRYRIVG